MHTLLQQPDDGGGVALLRHVVPGRHRQRPQARRQHALRARRQAAEHIALLQQRPGQLVRNIRAQRGRQLREERILSQLCKEALATKDAFTRQQL